MPDVKTERDVLADIAKGCDAIIERINDRAIAHIACDDVEELEKYHDRLAGEVSNLAALLRGTINALNAA